MLSAAQALDRLREGNRRFLSGAGTPGALSSDAELRDFVRGQEPFAVVLGCSDSRVPVELVFSQGVGDLFVIRVAGNVVGSTQMASVEFAVEHLGTRLVVVLGHTGCGAVTAALEAIQRPPDEQSPSLYPIVGLIRPAVEGLAGTDVADDQDRLARAVRANVRASAGRLRHDSDVVSRLIQRDGLLVVEAEYELETGTVDFFGGVPGTS